MVHNVGNEELVVKAMELDTKKYLPVKVSPTKSRSDKGKLKEKTVEGEEELTTTDNNKSMKVSFKPTHAGTVSVQGFMNDTAIGEPQLVEIKPKPKAKIESTLPLQSFTGNPVSFKLRTNVIKSDQLHTLEIKVRLTNTVTYDSSDRERRHSRGTHSHDW